MVGRSVAFHSMEDWIRLANITKRGGDRNPQEGALHVLSNPSGGYLVVAEFPPDRNQTQFFILEPGQELRFWGKSVTSADLEILASAEWVEASTLKADVEVELLHLVRDLATKLVGELPPNGRRSP